MRVEEEWGGKVRQEECSGAVRHCQRRHDAKKYYLESMMLECREWIFYMMKMYSATIKLNHENILMDTGNRHRKPP